MIGIGTIFLLIALSICHGKPIVNHQCFNDDIEFATKVANASIVVYGKATGKELDYGSDSTFHVTFQVDCILKGPAIAQTINITNAGRVEGKKYCQDLPVGRGYAIAFLERNPVNVNDSKRFIPSDFVEMPFEGNSTSELLANTCNLNQLLPLESTATIADMCPAVSTNPECVYTTMHTELTSFGSGLSPVIISGGSHHGIDNIQSKSGSVQVDVDTRNGVNPLNMSIFLILMALFVRLY